VIAAGQTTVGVKAIGDYSLHDFAAKYMIQQDDIAELARYRAANRALIATVDTRARVVLMGDSITFHWEPVELPASTRRNLVNRGIPGQNTSQMLLRFEDDVIALRPAAVVLLGGTNDLRVHAGPLNAAEPAIIETILRNVTAMADIADARGVKVILSAVPPIATGHPELARDPAAIVAVNLRLRALAVARHYPFLDYALVLADQQGGLDPALTQDGLHPNADGYRRMRPALARALGAIGL
jgi:lysophospholipase L1-like esterase